MPDHVREAILADVPRRGQIGPIADRFGRFGRTFAVLATAAVVVLAVAYAPAILDRYVLPPAAGPNATPAASSRLPLGMKEFGGRWTATNCATYESELPDGHPVDCARWGDSTTLALRIEPGEPSAVTMTGADIRSCRGRGRVASDPPAPAPGLFLLVHFQRPECGDLGLGPDQTVWLYHDPGSDTLWLDDDGDGWGLLWHRTR
jgi:hypothetical protein